MRATVLPHSGQFVFPWQRLKRMVLSMKRRAVLLATCLTFLFGAIVCLQAGVLGSRSSEAHQPPQCESSPAQDRDASAKDAVLALRAQPATPLASLFASALSKRKPGKRLSWPWVACFRGPALPGTAGQGWGPRKHGTRHTNRLGLLPGHCFFLNCHFFSEMFCPRHAFTYGGALLVSIIHLSEFVK